MTEPARSLSPSPPTRFPPPVPADARPAGSVEDEPRGNPLRLVRIRLWLALVTMAIVPMALSLAVLQLALGDRTPAALGFSAVMIGLTLVLAALTVWMTRQILRPAEELVTSRSEMRRMYELARQDSLRDGLTGLGNHRAFQEELDRQLEWYQRYKVPVALLLIDLDDLKLVNDSDGHAAGDEMLRELGRLIGQAARYSDRAFRIGGDEFAILMPHTDAEGALRRVAKRLLKRAAERCRRRGDRVLGRHLGVPGACRDDAVAAVRPGRRGAVLVQAPRPLVDRRLPPGARRGAISTRAAPSCPPRSPASSTTELLRPVYQPIVDLAPVA